MFQPRCVGAVQSCILLSTGRQGCQVIVCYYCSNGKSALKACPNQMYRIIRYLPSKYTTDAGCTASRNHARPKWLTLDGAEFTIDEKENIFFENENRSELRFITVTWIGGYERAKYQFFAVWHSASPSMTTIVCESTEVCGKHSLGLFVKIACIYALRERQSVHYISSNMISYRPTWSNKFNFRQQIYVRNWSYSELGEDLWLRFSMEPFHHRFILHRYSLAAYSTRENCGEKWKFPFQFTDLIQSRASTNAKLEIFSWARNREFLSRIVVSSCPWCGLSIDASSFI